MAVHVPTKDVKDKERLQRLHTKVDQLSTYMTVLKQKGDRTQHTLLQCQQKYDFSQNEVTKLQEQLHKVNGEKTSLEERLQTLEESKEELVRLNEELKEENDKLNKKLKRETARIDLLRKELKQNKGTKESAEKKCQLLERRIHKVESNIGAERAANLQKIQKLCFSHNAEVETLKKNTERMQVTVRKVTDESVNKSKQIAELQRNIARLNQFLASNESKRQEHLSVAKSLESKLSQTKVELEQTKKAHKEELSRDNHVSKLRKDLAETQQKLSIIEEEYAAYKSHTNHSLAHERALNDKLRHLVD